MIKKMVFLQGVALKVQILFVTLPHLIEAVGLCLDSYYYDVQRN